MSRLFYLSDDQWEAIKPHLPPDRGRKPRVDDRRVISGIIHVLQSGCRWKDAPPEYGYYTTLYLESLIKENEKDAVPLMIEAD